MTLLAVKLLQLIRDCYPHERHDFFRHDATVPGKIVSANIVRWLMGKFVPWMFKWRITSPRIGCVSFLSGQRLHDRIDLSSFK